MCSRDVLDRAEEFALRHAATAEQRRLLSAALGGRRAALGRQFALADDLDCVSIPRWVYAAIQPDDRAVLPLTVACYLLWTGIDLLDDAMDGDTPPGWREFRPAEITLAGMTLVSALAPLAVAALDAPPATVVAMQRTLAGGLLAMSAGQQDDVAMAGGSGATAAAVVASVMAKSGASLAMLATMAAQFAGAAAETAASYGEMGRALGTARQLQSDCHDLFVAAHSKDLASGTRTLPIALRLQGLAGDEREQFLALLDRARTEEAARETVRTQLMDAGALWRCSYVIEVHCEQARRALALARPHPTADHALRRRIDATSIFGSGSQRQKEN
jgi:geranylgeranyl pyrophosphate synthase